MARSLPSGTVTFLFTDIEGSTRAWQEKPAAMSNAHTRHDQILRQAIESSKGYVFQIVGDSFHAAFHNASDAAGAALSAQRGLHAEQWGGTGAIRVRMGLHTGAAELAAGDSNNPYQGYTTLASAQRIVSVAHGGQILLSQATRDLLQDALPADINLRDMGEHRLKDLISLVHLFQIVAPDLPADFPPLRSVNVLPNNLPIQLTSFIGRAREIDEAGKLLSSTRLLTLIGPGGTGKTRLALQIAAEQLPEFKDGIWLVELAPLTDPSLIVQTLASVLELRELPNTPLINTVIDYLRAKQLLLILDNCEHLIETCVKLSDGLLHACPQLKIIATSREALGITGETIYRVPSLSLPDSSQVTRDALVECEAVQLFIERAAAVQSRLALTDRNALAIAQICRRLDGIPLALELAAARVAVFSPEEIATRLDDRFKLLTGGSRAALPRHQTLRALIDWSYDLLGEQERTLLRQLSVFAGGWTFEAAQAVCSELDVLNLLTQLVNKSLVMVDEQAEGRRYHLLETIRQYGRDQLLEAGEAERVRNRHLDFFLQLAERAELNLDGPEELEWGLRLDADYGNLRAALEWGLENNLEAALGLAGALSLFWVRRGYAAEGRKWLSEALTRSRALSQEKSQPTGPMASKRARALLGMGMMEFDMGDRMAASLALEESAALSRQMGDKRLLSQALAYLGMGRAYLGDAQGAFPPAEESLALARELGDKVALATALGNMAAVMAMTATDLEAARTYGEEGIRLLREVGSRWYSAMTFFGFGMSAQAQGNYAEARSLFETCLPLFSELKDRHRVSMIRSELAHLERKQGHYLQAKPLYRETILEWQKLGHRAAIAHQLECFAMIAKAQEDEERAARLFGAAEALRERIHIPMTPYERDEYDREVNDLRSGMGEAAFVKAWAEGRALTMELAIEYASEESNG